MLDIPICLSIKKLLCSLKTSFELFLMRWCLHLKSLFIGLTYERICKGSCVDRQKFLNQELYFNEDQRVMPRQSSQFTLHDCWLTEQDRCDIRLQTYHLQRSQDRFRWIPSGIASGSGTLEVTSSLYVPLPEKSEDNTAVKMLQETWMVQTFQGVRFRFHICFIRDCYDFHLRMQLPPVPSCGIYQFDPVCTVDFWGCWWFQQILHVYIYIYIYIHTNRHRSMIYRRRISLTKCSDMDKWQLDMSKGDKLHTLDVGSCWGGHRLHH